MTQYYARVVDGAVFEVVELPDDVVLADCFAPAFVAELTPCDASIGQGWQYDGHTFTPPPPPPPPPSGPFIADSAASLRLSQAKVAASRGDTASAVALLIQHIETSGP